jgi:regulator of sigma D
MNRDLDIKIPAANYSNLTIFLQSILRYFNTVYFRVYTHTHTHTHIHTHTHTHTPTHIHTPTNTHTNTATTTNFTELVLNSWSVTDMNTA